MTKTKKDVAGLLGEAVARRREQCGLTQERVAAALGIGIQAISRIERGAVLPTLQRLFEFADLFNCGIEELLLASSSRPTDLALVIAKDIEPLLPAHRQLIADVVKLLVQHLNKMKV